MEALVHSVQMDIITQLALIGGVLRIVVIIVIALAKLVIQAQVV